MKSSAVKLGKIEQKIEDCLNTNAPTLNLRQMHLEAIPDSIATLNHLTSLILESNPALAALPDVIGTLSSLREIRAMGTGLTGLPETLSSLPVLDTIILTSCRKLVHFPMVLCRCISLRHLNISNANLPVIPAEIGTLVALENLDLSNNLFSSIPAELGLCTALKSLNLAVNSIVDIPVSFANLSSLKSLDISSNSVSRIPVELTACTNLTCLNLTRNPDIVQLPDEFGRLSALQTLLLGHCGLSSVPDHFSFPSLMDINLSANTLTSVEFLRASPFLKKLVLAKTHLKALAVGSMPDLTELHMQGCKLEEYPMLSCFPSLRTVDLSDNPLTHPPSREIVTDWQKLGGLDFVDLRKCPIASWPVHCAAYDPLWSMKNDFPDQIVPGLYLGDVNASRHHAGLVGCGVKRVVNAATKDEGGHFPDMFEYFIAEAEDSMQQSLVDLFDKVVEFITEGLTKGSVLVHCWAGRSRSATMVMAYLMASRKMPLIEAFELVKAARPVIGPNGNFIAQLEAYQEKLGIPPSERKLGTLPVCRSCTFVTFRFFLVRPHDTPLNNVGAVLVADPELIPTCVLAEIIGFTCFALLRKKSFKGHKTYAASFFLFGCMMTCAMAVHCFFYQSGTISGLFDVGLTSCVAFSLFFVSLVDLNVIGDCTPKAILAMILSYIAILLGYILPAVLHGSETIAFVVLYLGLILVCCPMWMIVQIVVMRRSRNWDGLMYVVTAGVTGLFGLLSAVVFSNWLCDHINEYFNGQFWWFIMSDVAMFCLYRFYAVNRTGLYWEQDSHQYTLLQTSNKRLFDDSL